MAVRQHAATKNEFFEGTVPLRLREQIKPLKLRQVFYGFIIRFEFFRGEMRWSRVVRGQTGSARKSGQRSKNQPARISALPSDPEMIFEGSEAPIILKEKPSAHVASVIRHAIPQPSETVSGRRNSPGVPAAPRSRIAAPDSFRQARQRIDVEKLPLIPSKPNPCRCTSGGSSGMSSKFRSG